MDDKTNPRTNPASGLSEPLRQAVEHVRSQPVPPDAVARALDKAERISTMTPPPRRNMLWLSIGGLATAAAAALLITLELRSRAPQAEYVATQVGGALKTDPSQVSREYAKRDTTRSAPEVDVDGSVAGAAPAAAPLPLRQATIQYPAQKLDRRAVTPVLPGAAAGPGAREMDSSIIRRQLEGTPKDWNPAFDPVTGRPLNEPDDGDLAVKQDGAIGGIGSLQRSARTVDSGDAKNVNSGESRNTLVPNRRGGPQEKDKKDDAEYQLPSVALGKNGQQRKTADAAKKITPGTRVWRQKGGPPTFARVYIGDGNSLELVSLDVHVTIEGPRARTVVDHVFRNPHGRQLEGTFEYPLPSGASPSYFAMFLGQTRQAVPPLFARRAKDAPPLPPTALAALTPEQMVRNVDTTDWGRLQEARVVGKQKALETYEEVVRGRIDPALLEYASGNTFRGRVFPIPASGYNRVILAYEELLPVSRDKMLYRFPLPDCSLSALHFTLQASETECTNREFSPAAGTTQEAAGRIYYTRNWTDEMPQESQVLFACSPSRLDVQSVSGRRGGNGPTYVYARVRPELRKIAADKSAAEHAVFLLDTSLSEYSSRFAVSMKLMRTILERDPAIKQFNVVAFNAAPLWIEPDGWLPNTPEGRERLFKELDGIVLEGATDVGAALDCLATPPPGLSQGAAVDCFLLSDGNATWGETEVGRLVARFEERCPFSPRFHCYLTGLGAENAELFEALTRRGGGIFSCRNEADLQLAAAAHRSQCLEVKNVRFVGGPEASDVLVSGRRAAVYPGGELVVAGRFQGTGQTTLVVEGTFAGKPFAQEYPVEVRDGGELAGRGWAEIAVASLLALNDPNLDTVVTAYCQQFNIGSRVASFLVLENEADYKRFNLEEERGKTIAGDLGHFLNRMWQTLAQSVSARQVFLRTLEQVESHANVLTVNARLQVRKLVSLMSDKEFETPAGTLAGALLHKSDVPPEYLARRDADRRDATTYLAESRRRASSGDVHGAVRVLSSIVEEHPSRGDALRLVGYRLLDLNQPAQAAQLFERVQQQRPFEPHSYRDLARALEETGNVALAAVQYEIVLGSMWHRRFHESIKLVAQEEYASLMQDALRRRLVSGGVADYFGERLERMSALQPKADLRVTISWNTDATDVDLWVIEPDGTKCFYQNNHTRNGGELSQDQTQGYGPERFQAIRAMKGRYRVLVHYFNNNPNLLAGETHVNVVVTQRLASGKEETRRYTVTLRKKGEEAEVCDVDF